MLSTKRALKELAVFIRLLKMKYGGILSTSILLFSTHVYKANQ